MARKEICALSLLALIIVLALPTASASSNNLSDLMSLISAFDDPRMDADDLAFYLATHGFNATPKDSYVEVDLDGKIYKLTPNGSASVLCDISA
jgi:hydrogenase/urease accessory protein HupE